MPWAAHDPPDSVEGSAHDLLPDDAMEETTTTQLECLYDYYISNRCSHFCASYYYYYYHCSRDAADLEYN